MCRGRKNGKVKQTHIRVKVTEILRNVADFSSSPGVSECIQRCCVCQKLLLTHRCINYSNRGGQGRIPTAGMRVAQIFVIPKHSQSKLSSLLQLHASDTHNPTGLL